ncbi:glycosyltransferase [Flavobacterium sp. SM15]|uniref:glycosyltransferase n=1 Tax=Flavobacterium sp. SM15 TaxID=2908005 RepID=UPI001EDA18B7|nr:glycosyltransferase [Flavobacterium sp. SM15]MCG2611043.1 glycosyltransferase [Flavobacterium sp. SM15]
MKISVALCTYNGEKFIKEQLNSILNQTIGVDEIVICDDRSKDNTTALINEYSNKYPGKIILHINQSNLGSNKNFEKAIKLCTGDYIFLSDQDDIWRNDKVAKTMEVFNTNPSAEGVFSNANFINDSSEIIHNELSLWASVNFFEPSYRNSTNLFNSLTNIGNFLTGATLCIKKEVKDFCFPFKTTKEFIHDEWFAFLLAERKTLFLSTENLISYRLHSSQQLGVGVLKTSLKKQKRSIRFNRLMLGVDKPKSFKDYKSVSRAYFYQYKKYKQLFDDYKDESFFEISENLKQKYIETDQAMKKHNFILYWLRKYNDKRKNKRQLD